MTRGGETIGTRLSALPAILAAWSFRSVVVATIGVGLAWTLVYVWNETLRSYPGTPWLVTAGTMALAVAAFASTTWVARRPQPFNPAAFIAITLLAGIAVRIAYLVVVEPVWVGDFLRYWRSAVRVAEAANYNVTDIYEQRALLYVPLIELFGERPEFLKGFNVVLLAMAQLAGYDTLRRLHSHQAAQAFTIAWLAVMETTASAAIPSHDLSGTALIAIGFWLSLVGTQDFPAHRRGILRFVASTILLAVTMCVLQNLRGLGTALLMTLACGAVVGLLVARLGDESAAGLRLRMKAVIAQALIAYLLLSVGMATMARAGLVAESNDAAAMLRVTTPQLNSMSEGSYEWLRGFHDTFNGKLMRDPERFGDFRKSLALTDYIERPVEFARNSFERSERLYSLGAQYLHYVRGWIDGHEMETRWLTSYNLFYSGLFAIFFLVALFGLLTRLGPAHVYFPLIFLSGMSLGFVTVLENQPRYIYPIWYFGCLAIALQLARGLPASTPARIAMDLGKLLAQAALFVAVVLGLAWGAASLTYTIDDGRIVSDWSLDSSQDLPAATERHFLESLSARPSDAVPTRSDGRFSTVFGPLSVQLEFPAVTARGESVTASRQVCISDADHREVSFQYYMPHARADGEAAFTLALLKDGERLWSRALPARKGQPQVLVPLPEDDDGCMELEFRLTVDIDDASEALRRASRTEIFFPRIERADLNPDAVD